MLSIDTNLLVYAQNSDCDEHRRARAFLSACRDRDVVICELVLVELYLVLRSAAIVSRPLGAGDAVEVCSAYRNNPRWRLYSRNHAVNASVSLRRARLRTDAGNQANSRPVPSGVCAERARTPRNRSALARAPMGWQRACGTGVPSRSSG